MTESCPPSDQNPTTSLSFAEILDVPGVKYALVVTADGLLKHHSAGTHEEQAESLAAAASGLRALGRAVQEHSGIDGNLQQVMLDYAGYAGGPDSCGGLAIVRDAAQGTQLLVVTDGTVDSAALGRAISHQIKAIGTWYLAAADRASG